MELLVRKRARAKAAITRIETFIAANQNNHETNVNEFVVRETQLTKAFESYTGIQDEIDDLNESADIDYSDREETETKYFRLLATLQSVVQSRYQPAQSPHQSEVDEIDNGTAESLPATSYNPQVRLPNIEIPRFCGKLEEWPAFIDLFSALIHSNSCLTNVQKLLYLKSSLKNEPLDMINSLSVTNENYLVALELLKKRFDKKLPIINAHINGLLEVPVMSKDNSTLLRQFINQINKHLKALEALDVPVDNWDLLLIHLYSKNLSYHTKHAFEMEREVDELPTLTEFLDFLEKRCSTLETLSSSNFNPESKQRVTRHVHLANESGQDSEVTSNPHLSSCLFCKQTNHSIYKCFKFGKLSAFERKQFIIKTRCCLNCFSTQHLISQCSSDKLCRTCKQKHHSLLHGCYSKRNDPPVTNHSANNDSQGSQEANLQSAQTVVASNISVDDSTSIISANNNCLMSKNNSQVLLATAKVTLIAENGNKILARALMDSASQMSFVSSNIVKRLGIASKKSDMQISGIANNKTKINGLINLKIRSTHDNFTIAVSCAVLDKITCELPHTSVDVSQFSIPDNLPMADKDFNIPSQIDVLLGADVYYDLINPGIINLGQGLPKLQNSRLGWVIGGPAPTIINCSPVSVALFAKSVDIDDIIPRFWQLEEFPCKRFLSPEDKLCEHIFAATTKQLSNGHFQVDLPLKNEKGDQLLGDSFQSSVKRFYALEKRFTRDIDFFEHYKSFIEEYVFLGHGKYVPFNSHNQNDIQKNFLPHHAVLKERKIRIVFDSSMKTSTGFSLNDILLKGPTVQPELFDIICRFRTFEYVLTADVQKMYRQVMVNPRQLGLQNILWRDSPAGPLRCIELQTVTYGVKSAPFLATRCLNQLAEDNAMVFPLASYAILNQCYVDDVLAGTNSSEELVKLNSELIDMLQLGGFHLHKWCSNDQGVVGTSNLASNCSDVVLKDSDNKILGLTWNSQRDIFKIVSPKLDDLSVFTKRTVLSHLSQVFDPLGFISPIVIVAKVLMQKLWQRKLDWDDELPPDLKQEWSEFYKNVIYLNQISIRRPLFSSGHIKLQLCGFCDASMSAFGAVVYLRATYPNEAVTMTLICSKSRVAPVKTISLPRLELCGALLLAKLAHRLKSVFHCEISNTFLWTDSQVVLHWLNDTPSRWTTFVAHRISEIQDLTVGCQWYHVQSCDNPADLISRGANTLSLVSNDIWWQGPKFLHDFNFQPQNFPCQGLESVPEQRRAVVHVVNDRHPTEMLSRFSNFTRMQRSIAYCLRFANNCKREKSKLSGPLSVSELQHSLTSLVRCVQSEYFQSEISLLRREKPLKDTSIQTLNPFVDKDGPLRVGGRLHHSEVDFDQKHPILLPAKVHFVTILIRHEHIRLHHAGPQAVLSNIRLRFWPLNGLRQVKKEILSCVKCHRFKACHREQLMGNLPAERVTLVRPFLNVGVDFGGPLKLKESKRRNASIGKAYIALFVCMSTKAVHIELVSSLSTESFLLTLRRFISRRGNPVSIFSDNGTNFRGASNELSNVRDFFKSQENRDIIKDYLASVEIKWKFIPPTSPHWGGLWEAGVKSTKYHLRRLVGNLVLNFEELTTVLTQIESVLNSRPLCPMSSDPSDITCLTPGHFLIGEPLTSFPDKDVSHIPDNRLSFWQLCCKIRSQFWKRFHTEYLNRLQHRPKWMKAAANLEKGMLVLIKEDNTPPLSWVLGRVTGVLTGQDGKVRAVEVQTKVGLLKRPITKLAPLPIY